MHTASLLLLGLLTVLAIANVKVYLEIFAIWPKMLALKSKNSQEQNLLNSQPGTESAAVGYQKTTEANSQAIFENQQPGTESEQPAVSTSQTSLVPSMTTPPSLAYEVEGSFACAELSNLLRFDPFFCDGSKSDCLSKGQSWCSLYSECEGITWEPEWSGKYKTVKWCKNRNVINTSEQRSTWVTTFKSATLQSNEQQGYPEPPQAAYLCNPPLQNQSTSNFFSLAEKYRSEFASGRDDRPDWIAACRENLGNRGISPAIIGDSCQKNGGGDTTTTNAPMYARHMEALMKRRPGPLRFVQVGVFRGESLAVWADYLPKGSIVVGLDVNLLPAKAYHDRLVSRGAFGPGSSPVTLIETDSTNKTQFLLDKMKNPILQEKYDVIIDDGCHSPWCILNTFDALYDSLAAGGVYFVEDDGEDYCILARQYKWQCVAFKTEGELPGGATYLQVYVKPYQ